jgi:glutathione synthase/RimK-type ligase-like ATP-grasp enzyme
MAEIKIAGIMRAGAYSPNHIGNDTAIFNATAEQLRIRGCQVNTYSEEQFNRDGVQEDIIMAMCREQESITQLQRLEDEGRLVINSGYGIENCTRERMTRILLGNGIPYPDSLIVDTNENVRPLLEKAGFKSCWIKRGDFHAMHKEDVSYVRHTEEAQEVLQEYFYRGIKRAVINVHLMGDLVKFYGIRGSEFFYWFYPFDAGHSKYGWEQVNGRAQGLPFDEQHLRDICARAAEELNIVVYGGDCIVDEDGTVRIIDFNDWPSFAPCRNEAAPHIARAILNIIKTHKKA